MSALPDYPEWTDDPLLAPAEPEKAYVWDEEAEVWELRYPYLNNDGHEIGDPSPMEPPIGYKDTPDIWDTVQRMVKTELLARELASQDYGSFEEEDDFVIGDDYEPSSPYENEADVSVGELMAAGREELARQQKETVRQDPKPKAPDKEEQKEDEEPPAS